METRPRLVVSTLLCCWLASFPRLWCIPSAMGGGADYSNRSCRHCVCSVTWGEEGRGVGSMKRETQLSDSSWPSLRWGELVHPFLIDR